MGDDLFGAAAEERLRERAPLAARLRPRTLDEIVGQDHLVGPGKALRRLIESDALFTVVLWGPPGTGKTTLAEIIASSTKKEFERLSAVSSGVKDLREVIEQARDRLARYERGTVLFVDEIHRFSTSQQDALLHAVESGLLTLVGATTENPSFSVNPALRSRATVFRLHPLEPDHIIELLRRGLAAEQRSAPDGVLRILAERCTGDARQALTALEVACAISPDHEVGPAQVAAALDTAVQRFDRDAHYDIASPFIKSMRVGDVDGALHWLARMVEGGEDPRFIARRLVIFASEDVGMADSASLAVAVAAAQAVQLVGLPEGVHNLAHAVVHLARAPKSRAVTDAVWSAVEDVRAGRSGEVPVIGPDTSVFRPIGMEEMTYYREDDG